MEGLDPRRLPWEVPVVVWRVRKDPRGPMWDVLVAVEGKDPSELPWEVPVA